MPLIQRRIEMTVEHYTIGDYVQHSWFRGVVIGINAPQLVHRVRVVEVLYPRIGRSIGMTCDVPFNCGAEVEPPKHIKEQKQ